MPILKKSNVDFKKEVRKRKDLVLQRVVNYANQL